MKFSRLIYLSLILSTTTFADVMNLNEYMPTRLEDASPIQTSTLDVQLSTRFEEDGKSDQHIHRANLRYGLTERIQLETMTDVLSGGNEVSSGDVQAGGLYEIIESSTAVPEVALNPMYILTSGKQNQGHDGSLKLILTSTLAGNKNDAITQLHLNAAVCLNDQPLPHERYKRSMYAFGLSHRLGASSSLVIDYIIEEEREKKETSKMVEIGVNQNVAENYTVGLGMAAAADKESPSWAGNISLTRNF